MWHFLLSNFTTHHIHLMSLLTERNLFLAPLQHQLSNFFLDDWSSTDMYFSTFAQRLWLKCANVCICIYVYSYLYSTSINQLFLGRLIVDRHCTAYNVHLYICIFAECLWWIWANVQMYKCTTFFPHFNTKHFLFTRMIINHQSKMCSALHIGVHVLCNCLNVQSFEICANVKKCKSASAVQTLYKFSHCTVLCVTWDLIMQGFSSFLIFITLSPSHTMNS